jgi:hypothetical protein
LSHVSIPSPHSGLLRLFFSHAVGQPITLVTWRESFAHAMCGSEFILSLAEDDVIGIVDHVGWVLQRGMRGVLHS